MGITAQDAKRLGDMIGVNWERLSLDEFQLGLAIEIEKDQQRGFESNYYFLAEVVKDCLSTMNDYYSWLANSENSSVRQLVENEWN